MSIKENAFEISCRNCRHMANAKDFILSVEQGGTEFGFTYNYIKLMCPHCGSTEVIEKTRVR